MVRQVIFCNEGELSQDRCRKIGASPLVVVTFSNPFSNWAGLTGCAGRPRALSSTAALAIEQHQIPLVIVTSHLSDSHAVGRSRPFRPKNV